MSKDGLSLFEPPAAFTRMALSSARGVNTLIDAAFYDVGRVWWELFARGLVLDSRGPRATANTLSANATALYPLDLSAITNPEGVILLVDPKSSTPVVSFPDEKAFLDAKRDDVKTIAIAGVGSSALGAAAFAWDIAQGVDEPVAAIVAGHGVADLISEALGGWIGFGVQDYLRKQVQEVLARMAPQTARIGYRHASGAQQAVSSGGGSHEPGFRRGSPEADVLHNLLLTDKGQIKRIAGHSKGCLSIANALEEIPQDRLEELTVLTFGCAINEQGGRISAEQFLGALDPLGVTNSWGNRPDHWLPCHHSTNSMIPGNLPVSRLSSLSARGPASGSPRAVG